MFERLEASDSSAKLTVAVAAGVAVAGIAAYRYLRPEKHFDPGENYFDIIANLDDCVRQTVGSEVDYAMLGGGASYALSDPDTTVIGIDIVPPPGIKKAQYREDTGTMADVDILVFTGDQAIVKKVKRALVPSRKLLESGTEEERLAELNKPGARLKIGVTGLESGEDYQQKPTNFGQKAFRMLAKDWVSHRLEFSNGSRTFNISDIAVDLPDEYFDIYHLVLKDSSRIPVLHPLIQVLCYAARTSHGIRERDKAKVIKIVNAVGQQFGAGLEWGPKEQTVNLVLDGSPSHKGVQASMDFVAQKNALRWNNTKERLGKAEAAVLAARMAVHRLADTNEFFVQFGQGGWIFDHILSRFTGEDQLED